MFPETAAIDEGVEYHSVQLFIWCAWLYGLGYFRQNHPSKLSFNFTAPGVLHVLCVRRLPNGTLDFSPTVLKVGGMFAALIATLGVSANKALGNISGRTQRSALLPRKEANTEGKLTVAKDPLGGTTRYCYDAMKRHVRVRSPNGSSTVYGYDEVDLRIRRPQLSD
jgi:YD repeat-containing protein